jgi:hypothetical protein
VTFSAARIFRQMGDRRQIRAVYRGAFPLRMPAM